MKKIFWRLVWFLAFGFVAYFIVGAIHDARADTLRVIPAAQAIDMYYCVQCDKVFQPTGTLMYCPNPHAHCNEIEIKDPEKIKSVKRAWANGILLEQRRAQEIERGGNAD